MSDPFASLFPMLGLYAIMTVMPSLYCYYYYLKNKKDATLYRRLIWNSLCKLG